MNVPNQTLVIPLPFVEIHQDLLLVLVRREVLEMLKIQAVNQEVNAKLIEIVPLLQHVVKEDVLILALVNVDPELFVKWLPIKPFALVPPEPVVIQDLNADNWNVSKIQNVPLEDLAFKVNAWMLVLLLEYVVPMPFVQF
jgi:hypothetical protein